MWNWIVQNGSGISAIAAILGLVSLFLILKQIRDSRLWNKLHFTYTYFPNPREFEEIEMFLDERIAFWKRDDPLNEIEVRVLIGKGNVSNEDLQNLAESFGPSAKKDKAEQELYEAGRKLKLYLNQIEGYCAAIQAGVVDSDSAKRLYAYKFRRTYERALPWIVKLRSIMNEDSIYIEMEEVLNKWFPPSKGQDNLY